MPAKQGVNSFAADPNTGVIITPEWAQSILDLGVTAVRVSLRADSTNHLPLDLYKRAFGIYRAAGIAIHVDLDRDFSHPWDSGNPHRQFFPNMALGYQGNKRRNQWIVDTCVRAKDAAKALSPLVESWSIGNEPNLALPGTNRPVHIGENVPPVQGDKAPALAPEVFYSLCYELDGWLRVGGANTVYVGALSWLPIGSAADIGWHGNVYTAGYMRTGMEYLHTTGVRKFPWQGFSTTSEGAWTLDKAMAMKRAIDTIQGAYGLSLPIVIAEWGMRGTPNPVQAQATFDALSAISEMMAFFQHPVTPDGWGLSSWTVAKTGFVPIAPQTPWYAPYRDLVTPAPVTTA